MACERDSSVATILVAEEDPNCARALQHMLAGAFGEAFAVEHAVSLADALTLAAERRPAVALLSLGICGRRRANGAVRFRQRNPQLPIVALLSPDDPTPSVELFRAGVQEVLLKGEFDERLLGRVVLAAIDRQRFDDERKRAAATDVGRARLDGVRLVARTMVDAMNNDLAVVYAMAEVALRQASEENNIDPMALQYVMAGVQRAAEHIRKLESVRRIEECSVPGLPPMLDLERSAG